MLHGSFLVLHTEQRNRAKEPPLQNELEKAMLREAPISLQSPLCSPIPPPSLPTAPVPEAQHDPVWAGKRARGSGRLECFEG